MSSATGARCVRCNSWLDPGAAFCAACGAPVTDRVIPPPNHYVRRAADLPRAAGL